MPAEQSRHIHVRKIIFDQQICQRQIQPGHGFNLWHSCLPRTTAFESFDFTVSGNAPLLMIQAILSYAVRKKRNLHMIEIGLRMI